MPGTSKAQILKRIEKLSARNADPIKLAVALANLDADKSSSPNMAELMLITQESRRTLSYLRSLGKRLGDLGIAVRNFANISWAGVVEIAGRTRASASDLSPSIRCPFIARN